LHFQARGQGKTRGAIGFALIFSLFLSFVSRQKKESKRPDKMIPPPTDAGLTKQKSHECENAFIYEMPASAGMTAAQFITPFVFQARGQGKTRGAIGFALIFSLFLSFVSRQKKESKRPDKMIPPHRRRSHKAGIPRMRKCFYL
jgi:hypothetical protein